MSEPIDDVRETLNALFGDLNLLGGEVEHACAGVLSEFTTLATQANAKLKVLLEKVKSESEVETDLRDMIDENDVIELAEAVRDGDRVHALRMLERVFGGDARFLAAVQQTRFERPRLAA